MKAQERLCEQFLEDHPDAALRIIEQASAPEIARCLESVSPAVASRILMRSTPGHVAPVLAIAKIPAAAEWLSRMPVYQATLLLRRLPEERVRLLLDAMKDTVQSALERLLHYPFGTVGSVMDPLVLTLDGEGTVAQALRQVEKAKSSDHQYLYVTDRDQKFLGILTLRDCMRSRPTDRVRDVMKSTPMTLSPRSRIDDLTQDSTWRQAEELPVVGRNGLFLGLLRRDTVQEMRSRPDSSGGPGAMESAMALGELYWLGLASVLGAVGLSQTSRRKDAGDGEVRDD